MKTINTIAKMQCSKTYRLLKIIKNAIIIITIILLTIDPVISFSQNGNGDPPPLRHLRSMAKTATSLLAAAHLLAVAWQFCWPSAQLMAERRFTVTGRRG